MNIACLMATYGRPRLVETSIRLFEMQTYSKDRRFLLVLDDGDQLSGSGTNWDIYSTPVRFKTLPEKYADGIRILNQVWPDWDALAIWDDDDIYLPRYLEAHASALTLLRDPSGNKYHWSHPQWVRSTYGTNMETEKPIIELSGGRFWAAAVVSRQLFEYTNGFFQNPKTTFDQDYLNTWQEIGGEPARPDLIVQSPQFVYGWGRSKHHDSANQPSQIWNPNIQKETDGHRRFTSSLRIDLQATKIISRCL